MLPLSCARKVSAILSGASAFTALVAALACDDADWTHPDVVASASGGSAARAGEAGAPGSAEAGAAGSLGAQCALPDPELADGDAADLFDFPRVPTFDIYLPEDEWEQLQVDARDEEYVPAQACFEGRGIGTVGLRFKGYYDSLYNCFNEQGEMICPRLSMKLKFSEYDLEQRFYGLKRLNFHAYRHDDSRIKERLAYDLYRAMGIVAPRAAWAVLRVNGESQGLYGMVEQVDGRFTADRWPENPDGNLYKELWPIHTDVDYITSQLETNEDVADVSAFVAFAEAMTTASDEDLRSTLARYVDLDYLARFLAVGDAIADYDGITYIWTDGTSSGNHNYYFYEEAPDQFTLIPWDLTSTFWINPDHAAPHWTELPEDCTETYDYWDGLALAPGCDPVFRAMAEDLSGWRAAGQELLDGPFAEETMLAAIDRHVDFIQAEARADPTPTVYGTFEGSVEYLRSQIPSLRARFEQLLAGLSWVPLEIDVDEVMGFEEQSDSTLLGPGTWLNSSPNSTVSVEINTVDPMAGDQDLLMSFEYANEEQAWQQYSGYGVPLSSGANDLSSLTGIRLWVRGDQERTLRLNIDGPYATEATDWLRYGWDVPVTEEATQVEVLFADAALADWAVDEGLDAGTELPEVLTQGTGLVFEPQCLGLDDSGYLPEGTTDVGFLEVDDIEFFE
jgi:spore coat protein H